MPDLPTARFQAQKGDDFVCGRCGASIENSSGLRNHCPRCLWSRHVDVLPGDRAESCGGMMRPVSVRVARGGTDRRIVHRCETCSAERACRVFADDDFEAVVKLVGAVV